MTRFVLILDTDFERQYQESIRFLRGKWFPDETKLKPIPPTDDAWYNNYAPHDRQPSSKPLGKTVW